MQLTGRSVTKIGSKSNQNV